jgi:3-hydroxyisobutyrate dehydrogenase-like beta-hydroxyacid dehydrogenase
LTPVRIGFVGFGEVASVFSKSLRDHGAEVVAYDIQEDKVRAAGIPLLPLPRLIGNVDYVLSTVTTQAAKEVAVACAAHLNPKQVFVDLNSTAPKVKVEIGRIIEPSGADFVEGAILGAVGASGAATRILTGGEKGEAAAETFTRLGLHVRFYSAEIGKASMFKMLRSIFSKGLEALILELLIAGTRAGIRDSLWEDVSDFMTQNPFDQVASNWVRSHAVAHQRRYHEMAQVVETLRDIGLDPLMTTATEAFFHRSGSLGLNEAFSEKPNSMHAVVDHLEDQLRSDVTR